MTEVGAGNGGNVNRWNLDGESGPDGQTDEIRQKSRWNPQVCISNGSHSIYLQNTRGKPLDSKGLQILSNSDESRDSRVAYTANRRCYF